MKIVFSIVLSVILLVLPCFASKSCDGAVSWYSVRKKDHTQPTLSSELSYVTDYDLFWCDNRHKEYNSEDKVIYLTFDAGYENGNIQKIVDVLRAENIRATFFVLDNLLLKNEDLVTQMIEDGHVVANHTMKHKDMTKMASKDDFEKELVELETLFESKYGEKMPKYYRPPEGKLSKENLKWAKELGYKTVMWSFAYADWDNGKQPSREYAMNKIMANLHNGEIMLLHPTSSTNAEIMPSLIKELKKMGYRFATVEELC